MKIMLPPTPFTVIGGFLGAGKTTLLNHILASSSGTRYAVLVNDFGSINIDQSLISRHEGQTLTLSNGCICCSLADGFISTMLQLMQRRNEIDHIIVEASGVSEPQRIMDFARLDPELTPDAILVLVDAKNCLRSLNDKAIQEIVRKQVQSASLLLINKVDLIDEDALDSITALITTINPLAPRLYSENAVLPLNVLLSPDLTAQEEKRAPQTISSAGYLFFSLNLWADAPLNRTLFDKFTKSLTRSTIRGKGILTFAEDPSKTWVWHRVSDIQTFTPSQENMGAQTKLVLICTEPFNLESIPLNDMFSRIENSQLESHHSE